MGSCPYAEKPSVVEPDRNVVVPDRSSGSTGMSSWELQQKFRAHVSPVIGASQDGTKCAYVYSPEE